MPAISESNATHASQALPSSSNLWRNPSALERSWTPPVLVGRDEDLTQLEAQVLSGLTPGGRVAASISGPHGSGTSTVASHLVATAKDRLARPVAKGAPFVIQVDTSAHRSPSALVTALFREIDPSYDGRGASAEFSLPLFLRRLRTLGRPVILVLDQLGAKADLTRVVRPLAQPGRLMPEGPEGLPIMLVIAAGQRDPFPEDTEAVRTRLTPLDHRDLCRAIVIRANLAFQQPPSQDVVEAIARLSVAQGWGLSMIGELLAEAGRRAEARGGLRLEPVDVALPAHVPRHGADAEGFGAAILEVLREVRGPIMVGELRRQVEARCAELGLRSPTQARLWRPLVVLERKGVVGRAVRMGGTGGSRTVVALMAGSAYALSSPMTSRISADSSHALPEG